jgi:hypothetical protein
VKKRGYYYRVRDIFGAYKVDLDAHHQMLQAHGVDLSSGKALNALLEENDFDLVRLNHFL